MDRFSSIRCRYRSRGPARSGNGCCFSGNVSCKRNRIERSAIAQWWQDHIGNVLDEESTFQRVTSRQLADLMIAIWVQKTLTAHVANLHISPVACGFVRAIGNKLVAYRITLVNAVNEARLPATKVSMVKISQATLAHLKLVCLDGTEKIDDGARLCGGRRGRQHGTANNPTIATP